LAAVLLAILIQNTVNYSKNDVNNIYLFVFAGASLVSNCVCAILLLISRKKQDADVNVKATFIFSSIDIYQNTLTIIAGIIMMYVPQSKNFPDLAVGCVFFLAILISALVLFEHHFKEFKSKVVSKSSI
jgi:Co/Zn/Cd efflux system component